MNLKRFITMPVYGGENDVECWVNVDHIVKICESYPEGEEYDVLTEVFTEQDVYELPDVTARQVRRRIRRAKWV